MERHVLSSAQQPVAIAAAIAARRYILHRPPGANNHTRPSLAVLHVVDHHTADAIPLSHGALALFLAVLHVVDHVVDAARGGAERVLDLRLELRGGLGLAEVECEHVRQVLREESR